jgi:hypothetical protein
MKAKTFDCVEMKRNAALRIYEETKGLSLEQRQTYWQEKTNQFLQKQAERKQAAEGKAP